MTKMNFLPDQYKTTGQHNINHCYLQDQFSDYSVIMKKIEKLVEKGGTGGVVALDRYGNISMPFNTSGMYRGWRKPGEQYVGIYKGE